MKARGIAALLLFSCLPLGIPIAGVVILWRRWKRQ
jgi:hypothetical protein